MSENNMNETVFVTVEDASVITVPIDTTLTNSGEAADAKAVGDALALKADASSVRNISVNGEAADNQGVILIDGNDIPMTGDNPTTLTEAIQAEAGKTAETIPMSDEAEAQTIAEHFAEVEEDVSAAAGRTGAEILLNSGEDAPTINDKMTEVDTALGAAVKTVNGEGPDENGNVTLTKVTLAENIESSTKQNVTDTFMIRTTGGGASISNGPANLLTVRGHSVLTGRTDESIEMTVNGDNITAEITDVNTFRTAMGSSGTLTLSYSGGEWSEDPAGYGITVSGTAANGDNIVVIYVKEIRGTITNANITGFSVTGWNLFNQVSGYARVVKYSETYGYGIAGTYTGLEFAATQSGARTTITPVSGVFQVPSDGYVFVTGGNSTTAIWPTWSDWTNGYQGDFMGYSKTTIDLSGVMAACYDNGLCEVGDVADYIDLDNRAAYQWIDVMEYTAENLETAVTSGRPYSYDENYIYLVRASAEVTLLTGTLTVSNLYMAYDHGLEMFEGTAIEAGAVTSYGTDLRNKLERDVLTISQQTLTDAQKTQVQRNLGLVIADNLTTTTAGVAVLDARQGKTLDDKIKTVDFIRSFSAGASTSKLAYNITIPSGSAHLLMINSNATGNFALIYAAATSGGVVGKYEFGMAGYTTSTSTNTLTMTIDGSTTRPIYITDIRIRGNYISVS